MVHNHKFTSQDNHWVPILNNPLQMGGMNKDKLRGALSRLILILYTPRLQRETCVYVLRALSRPGPIRLLPLLAKSSDKFFFRLAVAKSSDKFILVSPWQIQKAQTNSYWGNAGHRRTQLFLVSGPWKIFGSIQNNPTTSVGVTRNFRGIGRASWILSNL